MHTGDQVQNLHHNNCNAMCCLQYCIQNALLAMTQADATTTMRSSHLVSLHYEKNTFTDSHNKKILPLCHMEYNLYFQSKFSNIKNNIQRLKFKCTWCSPPAAKMAKQTQNIVFTDLMKTNQLGQFRGSSDYIHPQAVHGRLCRDTTLG